MSALDRSQSTDDFHLHTLVSDGDLTPHEVLEHAARRGLKRISITDHDALGAYRWHEGAVFSEARRLGLELTVGIEIDADMDGVEVHLLGFDVALDAGELRHHLESVRKARSERALGEIGIVNELLGAGTITEEVVFAPGRETLMKPHFIHPILDKGLFPTYEAANAWYRKNVETGVAVPKPKVGEAIRLVHAAGGWTALAHPGYYQEAGADMPARLPALRELGLDGLELDYPYRACSPHLYDDAKERAFVDAMRRAAEPLGLRLTRGSDCHTADDFVKVYGPQPA
jgi:predicted metal-dependent phosphoesterase TrpH